MNKIVILGGGYIGTNLANYIVKNSNDKVYVVGLKSEYNNYLDERINFIEMYIEQISTDNYEIFRNAIVIDAIGNINATNDIQTSSKLFVQNYSNKIDLLNKLLNFNINKYVFLSSGGTVYEDSIIPHKENENLNPKSIYAMEKVVIEKHLEILAAENNLFKYLILRLSNPYGGVVSKNKKQGIIDVTINKVLKNEKISIFGDLNNVRDYIYIDDLSEYIYKLSISNKYNEIFNIGTGNGYSIIEIFNKIEKILNTTINYEITYAKTQNIKTNILDMTKTKSVVLVMKSKTIEEYLESYKKV